MQKIKYILTITLVLLAGCTYFAPKKDKLEKQIVEKTQDNVAKAQVSNDENVKNLIKTSVLFEIDPNLREQFPSLYEQNDYSLKSAKVTGGYLERASNLIGSSSLSPVQIRNEVLGLITNNQEYVLFAQNQAQKESDLVSDKRSNDEKLMDYGAKYEEERNEKIVQRVKFWGIIGGGVALAAAFIFYILPWLSAAGVIPTALSLIPKKTLVRKVRAANNFLGRLDVLKEKELDKGDSGKVKLLEDVVEVFKNLNRQEEDEREYKMVKKIREREI